MIKMTFISKIQFFSPGKHGVIRFGEKLSARPTMSKSLYQSLVCDNLFKAGDVNSSCSSDQIIIGQIVQKMFAKVKSLKFKTYLTVLLTFIKLDIYR